MPREWTFDLLMRRLTYVGGIALIIFILFVLRNYLISFFLAVFVAYVLEPIVEFLKQKLKNRNLAVFITLFVFTIICAVVLLTIVPAIINELQHAQVVISKNLDVGKWSWLSEEMRSRLRNFVNGDFLSSLNNAENIKMLATYLGRFLWGVLSSTLGVFTAIFNVFSFVLYLVFIMLSFDEFEAQWRSYIPKTYRASTVDLLERVEKEMKAYFRGQTSIVLIVSVLFTIGFQIVGLPLAIVLGIVVGLFNYIPYMQLLGIVPAGILAYQKAMDSGQNVWQVLGFTLAVFVVVQLIQETLLAPRIMGKSSGLNPAILLLALSVWGGLFGFIGLIIAIPFTSVLKYYYEKQFTTIGEKTPSSL